MVFFFLFACVLLILFPRTQTPKNNQQIENVTQSFSKAISVRTKILSKGKCALPNLCLYSTTKRETNKLELHQLFCIQTFGHAFNRANPLDTFLMQLTQQIRLNNANFIRKAYFDNKIRSNFQE